MSERGSEGINFNEKLVESFGLAEKFRKSGALGEKTDQESVNVANEKVREILSTSFPVAPHAETQRDVIPQYSTVAEMVNISKNDTLLQPAKDRARDALFQIGLALSQDKEIFKAATEGTEELNKILVSSLHEIQPYILSVSLTDGKNDIEGQERVIELVDLFKKKKKAEAIHGKYETDYLEARDAFLGKLYEDREETINDEEKTGKIETMMGYALALDEKKEENKGTGLNKTVEGMEAAAEKMEEATGKQNENVGGKGGQKEESDGSKVEDGYSDVRNEIKGIDFDNSEQVLAYSRELLDYLENSSYSSDDINISGETTRLLNYILNKKIVDKVNKKEFKDIGDEIRARLALHDTAFYMNKASGSLSERSNNSIPNILEKLGEHDRLLTREVMRFFFDNNNDLPFAKAWNLLQEANFNYQQILRKAGVSEEKIGYKFIMTKDNKDPAITSDAFFGKKYINYEYDLKEEDKTMVYNYMIKELGGDEKARKALQLAEKMFTASGESSVVNVGFVNGDDLSEAIHFGRFREDDAKPGKTKNSGPDVHRGWIKNLTSGWLRNFSGVNDPDKPILADIIKNNLDNLEGKKDFYTYHGVIIGKKTGPLKELLLSKKLEKPEEIVDIDFFRSKIDLFNKLDPQNKKSLRVFWVAGLLQSQMMNRNNLWDSDHISSLKRILTKESLTLKGQPVEFFLTKEEWEWMAKTINLKKYFAVDFIADVVGDMFKMKKKR